MLWNVFLLLEALLVLPMMLGTINAAPQEQGVVPEAGSKALLCAAHCSLMSLQVEVCVGVGAVVVVVGVGVGAVTFAVDGWM